ncbi:unnamed protein product [Oppiella nova]|uniref:28S ribosomal protein S9, mitochondrial n=1 Tax=Oppiella nova TaxID=334625 RepID=A0A7R9QQW6_9ACAR|nr:unnamed protein product [Oppiella nova]CAG2170520.1 unnamed protein product [Oppiella nova]
MGTDANHMTQQDINRAIEYLMPSGLFSKRARPLMRPPQEIYPKKKEAQFDAEGRPFSSFFYTSQPNFYETSYVSAIAVAPKISEYLLKLNAFEDRLIRKGIVTPPEDTRIELLSSEWLSFKEMKAKFLEAFNEKKYESLVDALERLVSHPYSKMAKDFIMEYRKEVKAVSSQIQIPPLMYDENDRPYMTAKGMRKYCIANVVVRGNGTGKVDINGQNLLYFEFMQDR